MSESNTKMGENLSLSVINLVSLNECDEFLAAMANQGQYAVTMTEALSWLQDLKPEQKRTAHLFLLPSNSIGLNFLRKLYVKSPKQAIVVMFFGGLPALELRDLAKIKQIFEWPNVSALQTWFDEHGLVEEKTERESDEHSPSLLRKLICFERPFVIEGERGSGKARLARRIHSLGPRQAKSFVALDCKALDDTSFQSLLFGEEAGLTRGKTKIRQHGAVQQAEGGTLFLNHVEQLSLRNQFRLHRFLGDKRYRPLGASRFYSADVQVIVGASTALSALTQAGEFKKELLAKVHLFTLKTSPLRERKAELPQLIAQYARRFSAKHNLAEFNLDESQLKWAIDHSWPGNLPELEHFIEKEVLAKLAGAKKQPAKFKDDIPVLEDVVSS